jgi:hypothetical protein
MKQKGEAVSKVTGYGLDSTMIFPFVFTLTPALVSILSPCLFSRRVDHEPLSIAEGKNVLSLFSIPFKFIRRKIRDEYVRNHEEPSQDSYNHQTS